MSWEHGELGKMPLCSSLLCYTVLCYCNYRSIYVSICELRVGLGRRLTADAEALTLDHLVMTA